MALVAVVCCRDGQGSLGEAKKEVKYHKHANTYSSTLCPSPTPTPPTVTVKVVTSTECTERHNAQEHLHQLTHTHAHECAFCCLIRDSLGREAVFFFISFLRPCLQTQK